MTSFDLQQPNDLRASLTSAQGHDVASDALIEKSSLVLIGLLEYQCVITAKKNNTDRGQNASNELASSGRKGEIDDHSAPSTLWC